MKHESIIFDNAFEALEAGLLEASEDDTLGELHLRWDLWCSDAEDPLVPVSYELPDSAPLIVAWLISVDVKRMLIEGRWCYGATAVYGWEVSR